MAKRAGLKFIAMALVGTGVVLSSCKRATVSMQAGYGANPALPAPNPGLIPTFNIAPAGGRTDGTTPRAAKSLAVNEFASGLDHRRWLHVLPNGDVLVAESNAPVQHDAGLGLKGWVMGLVMARAGAGVPSADRTSLLRDADGDGVAETPTVLLDILLSPFGMALIGQTLYVANTDAVVALPYVAGATRITEPEKTIFNLPAGPINHHWAKDVLASPDGTRLFVTVGSNSNVDERPRPARPDLVATARAPDYALGAHTGSLALTLNTDDLFPASYRNGAFVSPHGSWNREPPSGYKVIFVRFDHGVPADAPQDIQTGFTNAKGEALGRPVGVAIDRVGALLVADDVGNKEWPVVPDGAAS